VAIVSEGAEIREDWFSSSVQAWGCEDVAQLLFGVAVTVIIRQSSWQDWPGRMSPWNGHCYRADERKSAIAAFHLSRWKSNFASTELNRTCHLAASAFMLSAST